MTNSISQVSTKRNIGYAMAGWLAVGLVLVLSNVCAAAIVNPSFEFYTGTTRPLPTSWSRWDNASFSSRCTSEWATDGRLSAALYSLASATFRPSYYQNFSQFVDLTGIDAIQFDVQLLRKTAGPFEHFEAVFLVEGVPLWTQRQGGVYLNQEVKVTGMTGYRRIEIRLQALETRLTPYGYAYWSEWDNLRLIERKPIKATIALDPDTLNLASNGKWITGYIEVEQGYDVTMIDGESVRLANVPAYMGEQGWAVPESNAENTADYDGDGVVERMVKFDRNTIQALIQMLGGPPEVTLKVTGALTDTDGTLFAGTGVIRVVDKGPKGK